MQIQPAAGGRAGAPGDLPDFIRIPFDAEVICEGSVTGTAPALRAVDEAGVRFSAQSLTPALCGDEPEVMVRLLGRRPEGALELAATAAPEPARVIFSQTRTRVNITVDGTLFAEYRYDTSDPLLPRPYFHPIYGAGGVLATQDGEVPGTREKHFHHTGLVLAHQNFTDGNNWQIGPNFSRMRHVGFDLMESGPVFGRFAQRLEWLSAGAERVVFSESRVVTAPAGRAARRSLDVESRITCGEKAGVWNATPYQLLALRVPDAVVVDRGGRILNSVGAESQKTAGAPAEWLNYSGPAGSGFGVMLMNHPSNPVHPTPWLNFENETVGAAPSYHQAMHWEPGQSRTFRFRVLFHPGTLDEETLRAEYAVYARPLVSMVTPIAVRRHS